MRAGQILPPPKASRAPKVHVQVAKPGCVLNLVLMMFVSILDVETRCSNSAASLVRWWVPTILLFFTESSDISCEDQGY